ncbi:glycosyl transferase, group 1, partial [mine drainage metagenome]
WGPQKNIELALSTLKRLKKEGFKFRLVLSGKTNLKFPGYIKYFNELVVRYSEIIDEHLNYVEEKEILQLFLRTDLVLVPYNTPGGHSGVLETAITFDNDSIVLDFPEYQEQAKDIDFVTICKASEFYDKLKQRVELLQDHKLIKIRPKIEIAKSHVERILINEYTGYNIK